MLILMRLILYYDLLDFNMAITLGGYRAGYYIIVSFNYLRCFILYLKNLNLGRTKLSQLRRLVKITEATCFGHPCLKIESTKTILLAKCM